MLTSNINQYLSLHYDFLSDRQDIINEIVIFLHHAFQIKSRFLIFQIHILII